MDMDRSLHPYLCAPRPRAPTPPPGFPPIFFHPPGLPASPCSFPCPQGPCGWLSHTHTLFKIPLESEFNMQHHNQCSLSWAQVRFGERHGRACRTEAWLRSSSPAKRTLNTLLCSHLGEGQWMSHAGPIRPWFLINSCRQTIRRGL